TGVRLAKHFGVRVGAHPGLPDRERFGRADVKVNARELELLLLQQVSALERIARAEGERLHHLKLHGALYHAVEASAALARCYVELTARWWPRCQLYVRPEGLVERTAARCGVRTAGELFADRAYQDDGRLVPRGKPDAVLTDWHEIRKRLESFKRGQR